MTLSFRESLFSSCRRVPSILPTAEFWLHEPRIEVALVDRVLRTSGDAVEATELLAEIVLEETAGT